MTDDLVTWLRAQLDDDERVARAAGGNYPNWDTTSDGNVVQLDTGSSGYLAVGPWDGDLFEVGEHIARHDPARVLAEVDAKRRILGDFDDLDKRIKDDGGYDTDQYTHSALEEVVRYLALPYADRPGYRLEWAPDYIAS